MHGRTVLGRTWWQWGQPAHRWAGPRAWWPWPWPGARSGRPVWPREKAKDAKGTLTRLWGYVWRQRKSLLLVVVLIAISTGLGVLGPWLQGLAIDTYIANKDIPGLGRLALVMIGVSVLAASTAWFEQYVMAAAARPPFVTCVRICLRSSRRCRCASSIATLTAS